MRVDGRAAAPTLEADAARPTLHAGTAALALLEVPLVLSANLLPAAAGVRGSVLAQRFWDFFGAAYAWDWALVWCFCRIERIASPSFIWTAAFLSLPRW